MNITLDHIKHVAKHDNILLVKGSALYRQGHADDITVSLDENDVIDVSGKIKDAENLLQPRVQLVEGEIIRHGCNCAEMAHNKTCRHVIAMLYKYMYETYEKEVVRLLDNESDPLTLTMIDAYLQKSLQDVGVMSGLGVQISPTLHLDDEITLSFQLGINRMYILKDIDLFLMQVRNEETVSYGKNLTFKHTLDNFDLKSQQLIHLLERRRLEINSVLEQVRTPYSYYYGSVNYSMKKTITLTSLMLDEFLDIYANHWISVVQEDSLAQEYEIINGNPDLHVLLVERGKDQYLFKVLTPYYYFTGFKKHYIISQNKIYRVDDAFQSDMKNFLLTMQSNKYGLVMNKKHMNAFYSSVLEVIQKHIAVDIQTDLSQYVPIPLTTRLYFDAFGSGVSVEIRFVYEDQEHRYGDEETSSHRNIAEEAKMILLIKKYFPEENDNGIFIMEEESQIFALVSQGLEEMARYCELYYSEDFKNIKFRPSPSISAGVRLSEGLLHLHFDIQDFDVKELKQLLSAYRSKKRYYRAKDGSFMQLDQGSLSSLSELMDSFHLSDKDILKQEITIPQYRAMQMDSFIKQNEQIMFDRDRSFKKLVRDFYSVSDSDFAIDPELKPILRNYQKSGYRWLKTMATYQFGGILADDMGLGKTLQVIALLKNARNEYEEKLLETDNLSTSATKQPVSIVITPASLVLNWQKELERFAPNLKVLVVMGGIKQRVELIDTIDQFDVVVTSYDLLKRDVESYQNFQFFYQIIDEAQYIKNHNTQAAKAVKEINSIQRFALSGTPVENSLAELWSIFDYLMPNYLYPYHYFKQHYETPIVKENDEEMLSKLRKMVQPFILRRLKKDVLKELPDKVESTMYCQLEGEQQKLYIGNAMEMSRNLSEKFQQEGLEQNKIMVLALLTKLRQLCCHPKLCYDNYEGQSAKLDVCMELVQNSVDGNHQVLIFSSFTSMLALIKDKLDEAKIPYFELTGTTSTFKRMELVSEFQNGAVPVFLISLKAGGTGLNLTAADVVIHFDPWWNISAQNQATDRTHRIGQTSNVNVYNLIAKDTIEEKILNLQEKKRSLADAIVEEGGNLISTMSKDDILSLFEV